MNADFARMRRQMVESLRIEADHAIRRDRWKMWNEMGAVMIGQAFASQAVILNPNIPLPDAVKLADSGLKSFMGLAEQAFAEAAK